MRLTKKAFQTWGQIGGRKRAANIAKMRHRKLVRQESAPIKRKSYYIPTGIPRGPTPRVDRVKAEAMYREGATLEEIGVKFGVTRERIRQIMIEMSVPASESGRAIRSLLENPERLEREKKKKNATEIRIRKSWGLSLEQYKEIVSEFGSSSRITSPLRKFGRQKSSAYQRGIKWNMSFLEWWQVWRASDKWDLRGRGHDRYVMARYGDVGAYEPSNVEIIEADQNGKDQYLAHPPRNQYQRDELGLTPAMRETWELSQRGLTVTEIATKRNVQYAVSWKHLDGAKRILAKASR